MGRSTSQRQPLDVALPLYLVEPEGYDVRATADLGQCLVTGAAGYLGRHLVGALLRRGQRVRGFDLAPPALRHAFYEHVQGDVRSLEDLRKACAGIDTIFHTAAVLDFARFASAEQRERSHAVNVRGVEHLVRAAREAGAQRLVHTSSSHVSFGAAVIDGDEFTPYARRPLDLYTETGILGERVALAASGRDGLLSCAIRPGVIYGPGESRVFPRVIEECASGRYNVKIGDGSALSDNTFIDNLVDGEIEAARHLLPDGPLCGQAYFINDGQPINCFEFFRPIVEVLGFRHPERSIPAGPVRAMMAAWECLHRWLAPFGMPAPPLLALEVEKLAVSHYSRIDKARRDFGWQPRVSPTQAIERMVEPCRRLLAERACGAASVPSHPLTAPFPNIRWLLALITSLHRFLYQASGGRIGPRGPGVQFLLLGCRGRKSGRRYVTPLLYLPDRERFVVVGSNAGDARNPAWWKNLQANPDAWLQVGRERFPVRARAADGAEAEALWPRVVAAYASFEHYRLRAGREIPLVLLERT